MKRVLLALACGNLLAGCFPQSTTPQPSTGNSVSATTVTIKDFKFSPAALTVKKGDLVTFVNQDSAPHTATAKDNSFDTGPLAQGASKTITFAKSGRADYACTIHPSMTGSVTVQ